MTDIREIISELWPDRSEGLHTTPPSKAPDLNGDAVAQMVQWFFENFEDPAQHTPRGERGYVWLWGGPYNAREELDYAFGDTTTWAAITEAVEEIEADGVEWAPNDSRVQPDIDELRRSIVKYRVLDVFAKWHRAYGATENFDEAWAAFRLCDVLFLLRELQRMRRPF